MDIYAILNLISALATLYFTINIIVLNPKNNVIRAFSYFALALVGWNLGVFYAHYIQSAVIFRIILIFLLSVSPLFANFVYILIGKPRDIYIKLTKIGYIINFFLIIFTRLVITDWKVTKYGIDITPGPLFVLSIFGLAIIPFFYGGFLLLQHRRKTVNPIIKSALNIILVGVALSLFLVVFFDFFLISIMNYTFLPSFANFSFIPALFLYIAIKKYDLLSLKPETILPYFFDYLGEGALVLDGNGKIVNTNSALLNYTNRTKEEIEGKNIKEFIPEFDKTKDRIEYEIKWNNKIFRVSQTKIKNKGMTVGYALVLYDITNRVEMEEELKKAKEEAYQAMEAESRFLSNMSHEMRTPLNGIMVTLDLLSGEKLTKKQREYISILKTQTHSLLETINEILDLTKIRQGTFTLLEEELNIESIFYEAVDIVANDVYRKGLELYPYIDPRIPKVLIGDSTKIREILINFLGNAVKFTDKGAIWIKVLEEGIQEGKINLKFIIKDTGIGIPKDKINEIFKEFIQVDDSSTRTYGGTGLGLAISKRLIEMMEGNIHVESEVGKGSTFSFNIKLKLTKEEKSTKALDLDVEPVTIISKNRYTIEFLENILKERGIKVNDTFSDLSSYIKRKRKVSEPEILLLDFWKDEIEEGGVKIVKENHRGTLIALLSPIMLPVFEKYESLVDSYVVKPIKQNQLFDKLIGKREGIPIIEKAPWNGIQPFKDYKVLLVEDNKINQKLEGLLLEKMGFYFDIANNGKEALSLFEKNSYDLILMDIQMPVMDGVEATKRIREIEKHKGGHIPILALTASAFSDEIKEFLEAGMDGFVPKPINYTSLHEAISNFLKTGEKADKISIINMKGEIFDPRLLIEDLGDEELLKEILKSNIKGIESTIKELDNAYRERNIKEFARLVHMLKGGVGSFSKTEFIELLIGIEQSIKTENSLENLDKSYKIVKKMLNLFLKEVNEFIET